MPRQLIEASAQLYAKSGCLQRGNAKGGREDMTYNYVCGDPLSIYDFDNNGVYDTHHIRGYYHYCR